MNQFCSQGKQYNKNPFSKELVSFEPKAWRELISQVVMLIFHFVNDHVIGE